MLHPVQVESGSPSQPRLPGERSPLPPPAGDSLSLSLSEAGADEECQESAILAAPPCSFAPSRDRDRSSDSTERTGPSPGATAASPHSPHKDFHYAVLRALCTKTQVEVESESPGTGELRLPACLISVLPPLEPLSVGPESALLPSLPLPPLSVLPSNPVPSSPPNPNPTQTQPNLDHLFPHSLSRLFKIIMLCDD